MRDRQDSHMPVILTTERWKQSRALIERTSAERRRIRFVLTILSLAALIGVRWYLGENDGIVVR
jgi:hypothetical protein